MSELDEKLAAAARAHPLLLACDYDGTLAPIVADPRAAWPAPGAAQALTAVAALPGVHVAVISGRALRDLMRLLGWEAGGRSSLELIGSHGVETSLDFAAALPAPAAALRARLKQALAPIAARGPGLLLEEKPAGVALHYRNAPDDTAREAVQQALAGPGSWPGVFRREGKKVLEFAVSAVNKGDALRRIRARVRPQQTIFIGDDATDEDAFAALGADDLTVKVGPGATLARHRVADVEAVVNLLNALRERRLGQSTPAHGTMGTRPSC